MEYRTKVIEASELDFLWTNIAHLLASRRAVLYEKADSQPCMQKGGLTYVSLWQIARTTSRGKDIRAKG